jgi:transcriptional regulator with XRE-family HTH domain
MKEILENIRKIRLEKRLKTKELAEKLGMTPPNYASIEAGRVPLTVDRLKQIAVILGVNHLDLLNGTASSGESNANDEALKAKYEEKILNLKKEKKQLEKLLRLTEKNHFNFQIDYTLVDLNFRIFSFALMKLLSEKPEIKEIISQSIIEFYEQDGEDIGEKLRMSYSKDYLIETLQSDIDEVAEILNKYNDEIAENAEKYWGKKNKKSSN